jgi:hypothetical protein
VQWAWPPSKYVIGYVLHLCEAYPVYIGADEHIPLDLAWDIIYRMFKINQVVSQGVLIAETNT